MGRAPFAVLLADDVIRADVKPTTALIAAYAHNPVTQLSVMQVAPEEASKYGMIVPGDAANSVAGLVEKPVDGKTPSLKASIGRYVLEPEIFDLLRTQAPGAGGEIQLADAIDRRAKGGRVCAVPLSGVRYDCGSKFGYLEAIIDFAAEHPEYGGDFLALMRHRLQAQAAE